MRDSRHVFERRLVTLQLTPEELKAALQLPSTARVVAARVDPINGRDTIQLTISSPQLPDVKNNAAIQSMGLDEAQAFFLGRYNARRPPSDGA